MISGTIDVLLQYIRTINTSSFKLTHGMKPRLPAFPTPDFTKINYGKGFVAERLQLLKKARQIARDHSMQTVENDKKDHDAKA
jgi:hypothetical protein